MKPYIRNTSHHCLNKTFADVDIVYNTEFEHWQMRDSNTRDIIQKYIKYCPFCGEKLRTCSRLDAISDFVTVFFG